MPNGGCCSLTRQAAKHHKAVPTPLSGWDGAKKKKEEEETRGLR